MQDLGVERSLFDLQKPGSKKVIKKKNTPSVHALWKENKQEYPNAPSPKVD